MGLYGHCKLLWPLGPLLWLLKLVKSTEAVFSLLWLLDLLQSREAVFFLLWLLGTARLLKPLSTAATAASLLDPRGVMAFASDCSFWGYCYAYTKLLSRNAAAVSLTAIGDCVTVSSYDTAATAMAIKAFGGRKTIGSKLATGDHVVIPSYCSYCCGY